MCQREQWTTTFFSQETNPVAGCRHTKAQWVKAEDDDGGGEIDDEQAETVLAICSLSVQVTDALQGVIGIGDQHGMLPKFEIILRVGEQQGLLAFQGIVFDLGDQVTPNPAA